MWHTLLKVDTGKCLHRASSAEQSAEVSHFVRVATLSSCLIMHGQLYWRVSVNEINAENETKPEMTAWQCHNTSAHFRTCYTIKVQLPYFNWIHYIIIVFDVLGNHFKWLQKECISSVVQFMQTCLNLLFSFPSLLHYFVFITTCYDLLDKNFFQCLPSLTHLCWLE